MGTLCGGFIYIMALTDTKYRVKIDITYSSTANATTATTSINDVMVAQGRPERAVRTSAQVFLLVSGLSTQAEAEALASALHTAWSTPARSYGKVSIVRTNDLD